GVRDVMRRRQVLVIAAGAAVLLGTGCAQVAAAKTAAARAGGSWGRAITVPGLAALNTGRNAAVLSVSCPSPGNCAAAGDYRDGGHHQQGFVVSERNGRWHRAIEVPGLKALNNGGAGQGSEGAGASAGYRAAGGGS